MRSKRSMLHVSISFQLFTTTLQTHLSQVGIRSSNVRNSLDFVKLPRIGRNSGSLAIGSKPISASASETSGGEDCTVGEKDVVIIVDHGSRRKESNVMLNGFVAMLRATAYKIVETAHMVLFVALLFSGFLFLWNWEEDLIIY